MTSILPVAAAVAADVPVLQQPAQQLLKPASAKPVKISWLSLEEMAARAIRLDHEKALAAYDEQLQAHKDRLSQLGISEYRVSQSLQKLQGKPVAKTVLSSYPHESDEILEMLDDLLAEIDARLRGDAKRYEKARSVGANEKIIQQAIPLYWQAAGAKAVELKIKALLSKSQKLLEPFIYSTERQHAAAKEDLLQLISRLKYLQHLTANTIEAFTVLTGLPANAAAQLRFNPKQPMPIPEFSTDPSTMDSLVLKNFAQLKPASLDNTKKYLHLIDEDLSYDLKSIDEKTLNPWLAVGKNMAFDLSNLLDRLERSQFFKQDAKQPGNQHHIIGSSLLARNRLAYVQYMLNKEKYAQAQCLLSNQQTLQQQTQPWLGQTLPEKIQAIELDSDLLMLTLKRFNHYAELISSFYQLNQSLAGDSLPEKLETQPLPAISNIFKMRFSMLHNGRSNDFSCYQSAAEIAAQNAELENLKKQLSESEMKISQLNRQIKQLKNPPKKKQPVANLSTGWLNKQPGYMYTLQILSSSSFKTLENYARDHKLGANAKIIRSKHNNKTLYNLLYGIYKNKELAFVAQFKLPEAIQNDNKVLIRRIKELQKTAW